MLNGMGMPTRRKGSVKYRIIPNSTAGYDIQSKGWLWWRTRSWGASEEIAKAKLRVLQEADAA